LGLFFDSQGRVKTADEEIYDCGKCDSVIGFAEALYWLVRDEGASIQLTDKDRVAAQLDATLEADEAIARRPGESYKNVRIDTRSGAHFTIELWRIGTTTARVQITKSAPFPRK